MIENDTQNSRQATSAALRNAPKLAKVAQAGVQGGPAGAATEAAVQYRKEVLVVVVAVLLLPILVLLMPITLLAKPPFLPRLLWYMAPPKDAPMPPDCPLMELAVLCCI